MKAIPVQSTRQRSSADEGADVVDLDATHFVALVAAATPLPRAPLLAARIIRARLHLGARDLLVHEAAPAPNLCNMQTLEFAVLTLTDTIHTG